MLLACGTLCAMCARCLGVSAPAQAPAARALCRTPEHAAARRGGRPPPADIARYALFWDADNVSPDAMRRVLQALARVGVNPDVRRAYGDVCNKGGPQWRSVFADEHFAVSATYPVSAQKNGADMELALDAMQLVLSEVSVPTVIVVSSDSDFVPLARRVRALGGVFWGFGSECTGFAYRSACTRFFLLDEAGPARTRTRKSPPPPPPKGLPPGSSTNTRTPAPTPKPSPMPSPKPSQKPSPSPSPRPSAAPTPQSGTSPRGGL